MVFPAMFQGDLRIPDEPRVAHTSWEMARTGDWVLPTVNGEPFLQTPPLHYWMLGALLLRSTAYGDVDLDLRLASVILSFLGTLTLATLFARRFWGDDAAMASFAVLVSTAGFWDGGQRVVVDVTLAFFTTFALYHLAAALHSSGGATARRGLAFGAGLGLAFLAKGVVGPAIVLSAGAASMILVRPPAPRRLVAFSIAAAVACLAVALPWIAALWARDPAYVDELLVAHVWRRAVAGEHHDMGNFAFFHRSLVKMLPWAAVLPFALLHHWRRARRGRASGGGEMASALSLAWLCVPFALLLASRSKREIYLLPLYPALAVVCGSWIARVLEAPGREAWRRAAPWVYTAIVLAVAAGGTVVRAFEERETSLRSFGRRAAELEREGCTVLGMDLEEREVAAIAWYLRHPFEVLDGGEDLKARAAALGGRTAIIGSEEAFRAHELAARRNLAAEQTLSRRRLQLWVD
jgi:4-amino-4-deoxy-L-arabinose transferase-like glycosyltransferase